MRAEPISVVCVRCGGTDATRVRDAVTAGWPKCCGVVMKAARILNQERHDAALTELREAVRETQVA